MKIGPSNSWQTVWENSNIKVEAVKSADKDRDERNKEPIVIDVDFEDLLEKELPAYKTSHIGCSSFYNRQGVVYSVPKHNSTVLVIV